MLHLPQLMSEVYGDDTRRKLIELLASTTEPIRYAEARRRVDAHPTDFQRAVEALESMAFIGRRIQPKGAGNKAWVWLEATHSGRIVSQIFKNAEAGVSQDRRIAREVAFPDHVDPPHPTR